MNYTVLYEINKNNFFELKETLCQSLGRSLFREREKRVTIYNIIYIFALVINKEICLH